MKTPHNMAGLSYVEVLVASVIIAVSLIPAMDALTPAMIRENVHVEYAIRQYRLFSLMEDMLSESYSTLETEAISIGSPGTISATYSDAAGTTHRRLVYLSQYDGDNADGDDDGFTGIDPGLLWVRVMIEGTTMELVSLKSETGID